ncbi:MAG: preprotein translocase subunit YajC [Microbacteriaceae bacterium]
MPDLLTVGLFAVLAVMIFFMFRNSRKRAREAEELRAKIQPGADVMTQHGIYGKLISLDTDRNEAILETTPGTLLKVHSQTIAKVVEDEPLVDEAELDADDTVVEEPALNADSGIRHDEPEFGERRDDDDLGRKKSGE